MSTTTHLLMRLENIHREARHALRRIEDDRYILTALEKIERDARLALAASEELFGVKAPVAQTSLSVRSEFLSRNFYAAEH